MALLTCYECNGKVSSYVKNCPHCGAPVKATVEESKLDSTVQDTDQTPLPGSMECIDCRSKFDKIYSTCPSCGSSNRITANPNEKMINTKRPKKIVTNYVQGIKCPACGKEAVQKISTANKVGSALTFGIFSLGHLSKTFKCARCGYKY